MNVEDYLKYKYYIDRDPQMQKFKKMSESIYKIKAEDYAPSSDFMNAMSKWDQLKQQQEQKIDSIEKKVQRYKQIVCENRQLEQQLQQLQSGFVMPNEEFIENNQQVNKCKDNVFPSFDCVKNVISVIIEQVNMFNLQHSESKIDINKIKDKTVIDALKMFSTDLINKLTNYQFTSVDILEPETDFTHALSNYLISNFNQQLQDILFSLLPNVEELDQVDVYSHLVKEKEKLLEGIATQGQKLTTGQLYARALFCSILMVGEFVFPALEPLGY